MNFLTIGRSRDPYAATTGPEPESELWTWEVGSTSTDHRRCTTSLAEAVKTWTLAITEEWWTWDSYASQGLSDSSRIPRDLNLTRMLG